MLLAFAFEGKWHSYVQKERVGGQRASSGADTIFTLESKGLDMQINGKFVDAVYGVKGLRSLKDQLSIGHAYYTGELAETYGQKGPDSRDRYHTVLNNFF